MARYIEHQLLAPDGTPLVTIAKERVLNGETIQGFITRNEWHFALPTRCFVNGVVIRPEQLRWHRIRRSDQIVIMSRPGRGGGNSNGPGTGKIIGSIVAMVALAVLAPWAGGAIAGALGLTTIAGVAYSTIIAGFIMSAGSFLLSQFIRPKAAKNSQTPNDPIYSLSANGNQAKPMGMIPVGYGRRFRQPEFAAPVYSTFQGDDQYLYQLFCIGCGEYAAKVLYLDDTPIWTAEAGFDPNFVDVQMQWVPPGQNVTLFPLNITNASEVTGSTLVSPSKDPIRQGWQGPFTVSPPGTVTRELWFDFVWPSGARVTRRGQQQPWTSSVEIQGRLVDDAGVPIGGVNAPWVPLATPTYQINSDRAFRVTVKVPVAAGRWQVRARRPGDSLGDSTLPEGITGHDDVAWTAARALIDGPMSFPGVTTLALVFKADATLSAGQQNRLGLVAARRVEAYRDGLWQLVESRNPVDAAIDMWRNGDYSAGLSTANLVLQDLLYQRDQAEARGDTFDHFFEESISLQDALEAALRVMRSNPAFIGDRLTIVRDEPKAPRMLFTDAEIVRGSLTVNRTLLDETWADGVKVNYFDERNWRAASVASAEGLQRPAIVDALGIGKREKAVEFARYLAAVNRYRRRKVSFGVELEGRLLKRGDLVLVQSELPQSWGTGGELRGFNATGSPVMLTLDQPLSLPAGQSHFILLRQRNGRPWGPVKLQPNTVPTNVVRIDPADLSLVQAQQGSIITKVLARADTEDPPTYSYSLGAPREYRGLVVQARMREMTATIDTVIEAPQVYAADGSDVPPIPQVPIIFTDASVPIIVRISARTDQVGAQLYVSVSWDPVRGAVRYLGQVALGEADDWAEVYRDSSPAFRAPVAPGAAKIRVRVACISITGVIYRFVETSCDVPPLEIDGNLFKALSIELDRLSVETQRQLRSIVDLGRGTLAYGTDQTQSALSTADDTIRGAIQQIAAAVDRIAAQQATTDLDNFEKLERMKVGTSANFAAIEREERVRISKDEALAEIQTTLASRLTLAEGDIVGNATAIQGLSTRVTATESGLVAQSQQITTLGSRIDATNLQLSGIATAQQSLTTRVSLTEGNISSLSQDLTVLRSTVDDQARQISGQATALDSLTTRVDQQGSSIAAQAQRTTALESTVSAQGGRITGNAQALQQLTTRTETVEGGLRSQSEQLTNLSSTVSGQGGQIGANAQAVSQLQTRASNIEGEQSAQASSLQSLSTTVGGHTATLTTYGTSIDGIKLEYGVAFEIDGATGGYVMTGMKALDGSGLKVEMKLSGDLFVDGMITSRMVSTQSLITTTAQIGSLTVDSINVKDGAISGLVSAQSSGQQASVTINVRTAGSVLIIANRTGDLSQRFTQIGTNTGALNIYRDGNLIGAIPANFTMDFDPNPQINASYFRLGPTAYPILDVPGVGSHTYMVVDDNSRSIGGVFICVQESK